MGERLRPRDVIGAGILAAGIVLATAGPARSESPKPSVIPAPILVVEVNPANKPPEDVGDNPLLYLAVPMVIVVGGLGVATIIYAMQQPESNGEEDSHQQGIPERQ